MVRHVRLLGAATPRLLILLLPVALVLVANVAAPLWAADEELPGSVDFRGPVILGFSLVFALVIVYLLMSHMKNARLQEEVDFLKRRVDQLNRD